MMLIRIRSTLILQALEAALGLGGRGDGLLWLRGRGSLDLNNVGGGDDILLRGLLSIFGGFRRGRNVLPLDLLSVNASHESSMLAVVFVLLKQQLAGFFVKSRFRVGMDQQALDSKQNVANSQFGLPVLLQGVDANLALQRDVGVEDLCNEETLGRSARVVVVESQFNFPDAAFERGAVYCSEN